jgi:hypothetical protein
VTRRERHLVAPPQRRPLRVFAFDPMLARGRLAETIIEVENEHLKVGPCGTRVKVVDYDASRGTFYEPVDLNDPAILMQSGLAPSESDPRFHQQMVYAVALKVLENFDRALGRRVRFESGKALKLFPHAFRGANAYYDARLHGVCFGYFPASRERPGDTLPGQTVFTCLSQDIIAHEVTHAVIARLREFYDEDTNPDVLAFHEGFADIVAIFQHFTFPDVLGEAIADTRGQLRSSGPFVKLAVQFGHATGRNDALRGALGTPDPAQYAETREPHTRGSILVAAVFDGFFTVYQSRIEDLIRIATQGRGVLPRGDLHPDLVGRLAREASAAAQDVLTMCIRAFEYLPPVDVTFGDFLRAMLTADHDLREDAGAAQRWAMIEAFRRRGIYPDDAGSLSDDALRLREDTATLPKMPGRVLGRQLVTGARTLSDSRAAGAKDTAAEQKRRRTTFRLLRDWARKNAEQLGLSADVDIEPQGFHATYRVRPNAELAVELVAQFRQIGEVRFVIRKPMSDARRARQIAHADALGRQNPQLAWEDAAAFADRATSTFRALHRGLLA